MATVTKPLLREEPRRPNIATAAVSLPAVRDFEQVDREIIGTLRPTLPWFIGLGVAVLRLSLGDSARVYLSINRVRGSGYNPPVKWGRCQHTFLFWIRIRHAGHPCFPIPFLLQ